MSSEPTALWRFVPAVVWHRTLLPLPNLFAVRKTGDETGLLKDMRCISSCVHHSSYAYRQQMCCTKCKSGITEPGLLNNADYMRVQRGRKSRRVCELRITSILQTGL